MTVPVPDLRRPRRRALDEQITSEPPLPPLGIPPEATTSAVEAHLPSRPRPMAVAGVVENGLVRPLTSDAGAALSRSIMRRPRSLLGYFRNVV